MYPAKRRLQLSKLVFMVVLWTGISVYFNLYEFHLLVGSGCYVPDHTGELVPVQFPEEVWKNIIVSALGGFLGGVIGGSLEVYIFSFYLRRKTFFVRIITKTLLILVAVYLVYIMVAMVYQAWFYGNTPFSLQTWKIISELIWTRIQFFRVINWLIVIISTYALLELSNTFGSFIFWDYLIGKYHIPKVETRIFMFLDIKSSTRIAELLGHKRYFTLLNTFFGDITDPVVAHRGEIYQYVGDEIVVSWRKQDGLQHAHCIHCFFDIEKQIERLKDSYLSKFGVCPEFKAGIHIGEVMVGEMGIQKRDLIFSGDVLNTASRIQMQCNTLQAKLLISGDLYDQLPPMSAFFITHEGDIMLKGKQEKVPIYQLQTRNTDLHAILESTI